jgi:hypothetical protein
MHIWSDIRRREDEYDALIFHLLFLLVFQPTNLKSTMVTAALEAQGCD